MPTEYFAWINGTKSNIRITEDGALLQSAYFDSVIIEAPGVNDETDILELTLNPATTTTFAFSNVTTGYQYLVVNDGSTAIKYNVASKGYMGLEANDIVQEDNMKFTSLLVANALTTSADIRVRVSGV